MRWVLPVRPLAHNKPSALIRLPGLKCTNTLCRQSFRHFIVLISGGLLYPGRAGDNSRLEQSHHRGKIAVVNDCRPDPGCSPCVEDTGVFTAYHTCTTNDDGMQRIQHAENGITIENTRVIKINISGMKWIDPVAMTEPSALRAVFVRNRGWPARAMIATPS